MDYIRQQINADWMPAGYEASISDIIDYGNVLILHVTPEEDLEHYIISFGYENGKFIIWDPAKGLSFMSEEELEKIWLSKKCLGLIPNSSFKSEKENKRGKRDWVLENNQTRKGSVNYKCCYWNIDLSIRTCDGCFHSKTD